jgi:hypothetical protein
MASQYNYTPLPSYANDVKAPLLAVQDQGGVIININQVESPHTQEQTGCGARGRCNDGGVFGRIRARCAARRLEKYGPL